MGESVGYGTRTVSGTISDKIGKRKPLILLGYGLSTLTKPFFAVSASWTHVLGIRITDRIGKGIRTSPRDALLADSIEPANLGKAFGLHRTMDQAGAIIGPLIAFGISTAKVSCTQFKNHGIVYHFSYAPTRVCLIGLTLSTFVYKENEFFNFLFLRTVKIAL